MRLFILLVFWSLSTVAQNKQLLYNVDDLPQTLMSNPGAAITFEKHLGIPLLSGISVEGGSSGVSVYDIFRADTGINVALSNALTRLDAKDYFSLHQQLEVLSFGWKSPRSEIYFSGGLYQELDAILYFPKDLATLAYRGNVDFIDVPVDFSEVSLAAEVLSVYHFGVNKQINKKWQLGARAKIYMSLANVNSINNRGFFSTETTQEGPNFYRHSLRDVTLRADTSGLSFLFDDTQEFSGGDYLKNAFLSSNIGLGLDVGFTHFLNDHWTLTGSAIDLGYILHSKDVKNYRAVADYDLNGIELQFPSILNGQGTTPYWQELEDEVGDQIELEADLSERYITSRPLKLNASIQYAYRQELDGSCDCRKSGRKTFVNKTGIQLYSIARPQGLQTAITGYYDKIWNSHLRTKITYTFDERSAKNVGLLVSTTIDKFNFYLAADNVLEYPNIAKARGASFQVGMQLVLDPK